MWCCRNVPETCRSSFALIAALLFVLPVPAQDAPPKEGEPGAKPPEPKTVEEVLKDSDRIDGLFTLYRDRKTGDLRMALTADELEKSYLYFTYTENGVPAAGQFRGAFGIEPRRRCSASAATTTASSSSSRTRATTSTRASRLRARRMPTSAMPSRPTEKIEAEDAAQGRRRHQRAATCF